MKPLGWDGLLASVGPPLKGIPPLAFWDLAHQTVPWDPGSCRLSGLSSLLSAMSWSPWNMMFFAPNTSVCTLKAEGLIYHSIYGSLQPHQTIGVWCPVYSPSTPRSPSQEGSLGVHLLELTPGASR